MALKFTKLPATTFKQLVLNAGILVDEFTPSTGVYGNILGATTGGIQFAMNPTYIDFGEDVDNCPPNTKQLKRMQYCDPTMSGNFLTVSPARIASLVGVADVDSTENYKVVTREQLEDEDFEEVWWIGDYSDKNTGNNAGYLAIHLLNALNTSGFNIQSTKDGKGQMSFEYHGHYDLDDEDMLPPFEIYCKAGTAPTTTGGGG